MLNSMTTSIIKIQITNEKRRQRIWWIMTSSTVPILHLYIKKEEPSVNFSSRTNINKSISGRTKNLNPLLRRTFVASDSTWDAHPYTMMGQVGNGLRIHLPKCSWLCLVLSRIRGRKEARNMQDTLIIYL